ncbi:MAG: acyl carrier protein [Christensenellales bacterium]
MITEKVIEILALHLEIDPAKITPDSVLTEEFDIDSLDIVELIMNLENEFDIEITDDNLPAVRTVQDIVQYIANSLQKQT